LPLSKLMPLLRVVVHVFLLARVSPRIFAERSKKCLFLFHLCSFYSRGWRRFNEPTKKAGGGLDSRASPINVTRKLFLS
jgi:hypothetical protein